MSFTRPDRRLLEGPPLTAGAESFQAHLARLGGLWHGDARGDIIAHLEASGLLGRGGAAFPVGRKWRAIADRNRGRAVVVANGAEGEPASFKDRVLMATRPHLVIDGAVLAAEAVGADDIVFYVGVEHKAAVAAMRNAVGERRTEIGPTVRLVTAPTGYVAGEASAVVHYLNRGDARPTTTPPRVSERGVAGRPTLVQNVESLAYTALIARFGEGWYRTAGRHGTRGTALITVSGAVRDGGVREIEIGTAIEDIAADCGLTAPTEAILLGGYFGTWVRADEVWSLPLDPAVLKARDLSFGCGIVGLLPVDSCGVTATARVMDFMAGASAGQCGPCVFGLGAIAGAMTRLARGEAGADDLDRIEMLASRTTGRGACRHPDGAVQLLASALDVFGGEIDHHVRTGRCTKAGTRRQAA